MRFAAATDGRLRAWEQFSRSQEAFKSAGLLLPGAFFVAIGAQLFTAFMFIYFAFATFL
jgi:hypothetical protein